MLQRTIGGEETAGTLRSLIFCLQKAKTLFFSFVPSSASNISELSLGRMMREKTGQLGASKFGIPTPFQVYHGILTSNVKLGEICLGRHIYN